MQYRQRPHERDARAVRGSLRHGVGRVPGSSFGGVAAPLFSEKSEFVRIRPIKGRSIKASIKASVKESIKASISRQASNHRQACASFPTCASCHMRVLPPARLAHLYNLRVLPADKLARSPSRGGQAVHSCVEQASVSGVQMVRVPRCVAEEAGAGRRTRGERPAPDEVTTPPSWPS